jgi:hypothetical protein
MCHHAQQLRTGSRFRYGATVSTGPLPRKVQMARFIPVRSQCQFDTRRRRFAERLGSRWRTITSGGATSRSNPRRALPRLRRPVPASWRPHSQRQGLKYSRRSRAAHYGSKAQEINLSPFPSPLFPFSRDTSGARRFVEAPSDSKGGEGKATASNSYPVLLGNKSAPFTKTTFIGNE